MRGDAPWEGRELQITIDQIIAIVSSFGTLVAGGATLLTVREMSRQRITSYHPELMPERTLISGRVSSAQKGLLLTSWRDLLPEGKPVFAQKRYRGIPIRNVGLGAARDVSVNWVLLVETWASEIESRFRLLNLPQEFHFENGKLRQTDGKMASAYIPDNQKTQTIDYVLPASHEEGLNVIWVPIVYERLVAGVLKLISHDVEYNLGFPDITAVIKYTDIGGNPFIRAFKFSFDLIEATDESFSAMLTSTRVDWISA